jgi:hypothetical protein
MAEEAKQGATIMVRMMNNIDIAFIGAAAGFLASKMMNRNQNQMGM